MRLRVKAVIGLTGSILLMLIGFRSFLTGPEVKVGLFAIMAITGVSLLGLAERKWTRYKKNPFSKFHY